jgi:hypothetical protein
MTYTEKNCVFEHEGKAFEAGGAYYDGRHAVGYVGELIEPAEPKPHSRALTNWAGERIGTCYLASGWRVNSYIGSHMHQIYATIDGVKYTGRGFGEGMSVKLRRCAKQ